MVKNYFSQGCEDLSIDEGHVCEISFLLLVSKERKSLIKLNCRSILTYDHMHEA